jgi:hypothetical protein
MTGGAPARAREIRRTICRITCAQDTMRSEHGAAVSLASSLAHAAASIEVKGQAMTERVDPISLDQLREERELLDKVRRLIALTSSPQYDEAHLAARMACRLIREHGLLIAPTHAERALKDHEETTARLARDLKAPSRKDD